MAKTDVFEADPTVVAKAAELRKELKRLVRTIVDDEDYSTDAIDQAREILSVLKDLKVRKRSLSLRVHQSLPCPDEFRCPLSKELMRDPVVVATGQTYDRPFIQKWLKGGHRTCPQTQQVLSHTMLTPNHLIREMISQWCKSKGIELSDPIQYTNEDGITESDRDYFLSLLEKMSLTPSDQKEGAKELRMLTKRMPSVPGTIWRVS
ncbi:hypothetical protein L1049_004452 [Liquidambar formosana]|uniref:RING-type E3 ubiquitin transferase n=1 Tax=Liquidambar formosana TaxID=63359 RepID=A0AAP0RN85_LIQFO